MGKSTRRRAWSELLVHLLEDIADRLLIADYIRFGSVCKSWRMVFLGNPYKKLLPPGLIARNKGCAQTCNFYSLVEKRVYDFPLWMPHELLDIRGSCFGWLITSLWKDGLIFVHLLNPFCSDNHRQIIHLPPLNFTAKHNINALSSKIVISANPTLVPNNYVVLARFSYRRFIYIKAGGKAWKSLVWENSGCICDFTYSNKTKQFYAVDRTGAAVAIEIDANPDSVDQSVKMTQVAASNHKHPGLDMYLVASSSAELWLVYQESFYSKMESIFHVYKLDQITGGWIPILSLLDQTMFLGFHNSTCLSASEVPACKPNCIYFTDATDDEFGSSESHDMRVFSLDDGKTEVHYLFKQKKGDFTPVWLEPTIRGWT